MVKMEAYFQIMTFGGVLSLLGIFLTWNLARIVEHRHLRKKGLSWLVLVGGLVTAAGFLPGASSGGDAIEWAILLGPVLIGYALSESGLVRANIEMLLQTAVVGMALVLGGGSRTLVVESFSVVSTLLLINALAFYMYIPSWVSRVPRTAAWIFMTFFLLNAIYGGDFYVSLLYLLSQLLWISALIRLNLADGVLHTSAQEGL
ncbi:hypothetical protein [Thermococcus sp.]|uniref:hypothetical protein n=1 Tax=Thermococcus sp. TaxID=35749 RepID=UPI0026337439|nr:hypothetical protein [Thermococcus sp.]